MIKRTVLENSRVFHYSNTRIRGIGLCTVLARANWRKNAERFKPKSLRYYSQAIGGDPFTLGRVMVYEYDSLADWEYFEKEMEKDKKAMALKDQLFANIDLRTRKVVELQDRQRSSWLE